MTANLGFLRKVSGPIKVHVDNKGIIDGLRQGERECFKPRAGDTDLCIKIGKTHMSWLKRGILVEVAHVTAHRTKEEEKMTKIEMFVTEGNEKAGELAKAGAMLDEGFLAEARAETLKKEREEEVYVALQYAASFHCLVEELKDCEELRPKPKERWIFVDKRRERMKHRTEWCAEADRYRCMRCGRGSKYMKMDQNSCRKDWKMGGHDLDRRIDRQGEV